MPDLNRMVEQLLTFIRIPSPSKQEGKMAAAVQEELVSLGVASRVDQAGAKIGGEIGNLIAKVPGTVEGPSLLLNAHLDNVVTGNGIKPRIEGDRIVSDGSTILGADDKVGVVAILELVRDLKEKNITHLPLELVFTVAEEIGLWGAKHLDYTQIESKVGFALDGGGPIGGFVVQAPSQDSLGVVVLGKAAHAGVHPEEGINAIAIASQAIAEMRLGRIDKETTANIGIIKGGQASNIVPDRVEIWGEARSHDEQKLAQQVEHMVERFKSAAAQAGGEAEVEASRSYHAYRLTEDSPSVQIGLAAARQIGRESELKVGGGGSDANIFNAQGISVAIPSTGNEKPHSTEEYVSLPELDKLGEMMLALVECATERLAGENR